MIQKHEVNRLEAIRRLVGGRVSGNTNGSETHYKDGQTPPSESDVDAKYNEVLAEWDAQAYARNRSSAYPSTGDQLDMQNHDQLDGTTTWKDAVAKVKSDNPKPTE